MILTEGNFLDSSERDIHLRQIYVLKRGVVRGVAEAQLPVDVRAAGVQPLIRLK